MKRHGSSGHGIMAKAIDARAARILAPIGILMAGSFAALTQIFRTAPQDDHDRKWDYGLKCTPPYVPQWRRPASVAQGKIEGAIPEAALAFETGRNGLAFSSLTEWIDACNAADVPGAIETSVEVVDLPRRYLFRGLYGAGSKDVTIRWMGRPRDASHCWLHVFSNDVIIRGINFEGFNCVIGLTYPTLPLLKDSGGNVDVAPYHTATEPVYQALCSNEGGSAADFGCGRIGRISPNGEFRIRAITIKRQIARKTRRADKTNNHYFDDILWLSVLENVQIFGDADISTKLDLIEYFNTRSSETGYVAISGGQDEVFVGAASPATPAIAEIMIDGEGDIDADVRTPSIDISHCSFTDTNIAFGAILDVSELGKVVFCKNDMPGTWGGVAAFVTRWSEVYFANNHWRDCWARRAPALGRKSSALPSGHSMTAFNTACYIGCNSPVMMRYHKYGNMALIENNHVENVESINQSNDVNSSVLADVRNGWQASGNEKYIRISYNYVKHLISNGQSQDCNVFYGKLRGFSVVANYLEDFGPRGDGHRSERAEAAAALFKNPGPYNGLFDGSLPEPSIISGNQFVDGPHKLPWVKVDDAGAAVVIEQNRFSNWQGPSSSLGAGYGPVAGIIRLTDHQVSVKINSNLFENISFMPGRRYVLINLWNMKSHGNLFEFGNFEISGNLMSLSATSTYPEPDRVKAFVSFRLDNARPTAPDVAFSAVGTGGNRLRLKSREVVKLAFPVWYDNEQKDFPGNYRSVATLYDAGHYLSRYALVSAS